MALRGGFAVAGAGLAYATGNGDSALAWAHIGSNIAGIAGAHLIACFTGETPIVTSPEGASQRADTIGKGDLVLARSEFDPHGPLELKRVEEVFVRRAPVVELVVRGKIIGTTAEHPFYVVERGQFVPAHALVVGETLLGYDGQPSRLEALRDTGRIADVYNFRIADHHTYFVGCDEWGFSVWAHNTYFNPALRVNSPDVVAELRTAFNATGRASFIKEWAATSAQAKRLLSSDELAIAARKGVLPDGLIVHHLVPLYRGGTNAFDNLRVMRQSFHTKFRDILHNYPDGQNPYGR